MLKVPETVPVLGTLSQMTVIYPINLNPDVAACTHGDKLQVTYCIPC